MNEQEAKDRCAQLAAEHPDRATGESQGEPPTIADDPSKSELGGPLPPGWWAA